MAAERRDAARRRGTPWPPPTRPRGTHLLIRRHLRRLYEPGSVRVAGKLPHADAAVQRARDQEGRVQVVELCQAENLTVVAVAASYRGRGHRHGSPCCCGEDPTRPRRHHPRAGRRREDGVRARAVRWVPHLDGAVYRARVKAAHGRAPHDGRDAPHVPLQHPGLPRPRRWRKLPHPDRGVHRRGEQHGRHAVVRAHGRGVQPDDLPAVSVRLSGALQREGVVSSERGGWECRGWARTGTQ